MMIDAPGYPLSRYQRIHERLRPKYDEPTVEALLWIIKEGSPAGASAGKKSRARLNQILEDAKVERDRGLQGWLRRLVRMWEEKNGLDTTMPVQADWEKEIA